MISKFHDRLDLKLTTLEYTAPECGSPSATTGKPQYCDSECPTFARDNGDVAKNHPHIFKRMKDLVR